MYINGSTRLTLLLASTISTTQLHLECLHFPNCAALRFRHTLRAHYTVAASNIRDEDQDLRALFLGRGFSQQAILGTVSKRDETESVIRATVTHFSAYNRRNNQSKVNMSRQSEESKFPVVLGGMLFIIKHSGGSFSFNYALQMQMISVCRICGFTSIVCW